MAPTTEMRTRSPTSSGYVADRYVIEWMEPELDVSGGKPIEQRPSLLAAIEGVERGEYAGIVSANLKRLTRSRSGIAIWERVEAAGGRVHCAAEGIDTSTPNGRFIRDIHLAEAVREREEHAERHAGGVPRLSRQAVAPTTVAARVPVRRSVDADGRFRGGARRLVVDPETACDVRDAATDVIAGVPVVRIAERLRMTPSGVRHMLRNRVYIGELRDGPNVKLQAHEAILQPDIFDAVAEALTSNPRPSRRVADGPALLAGIVRCASCAHAMSRKTTKRLIYACPRFHSGGACPTPAAVTCDLLDEYVERLAVERYIWVEARGHSVDDVGEADAALLDAKADLSALVKTITAAGLEEHDIVDELRARKASVVEAEQRLREARARSFAPVALPGDKAYQRLSKAGRNAALRGLIERVEVVPVGRGKRVPVANRVRVIFQGDD